MTKMSTVQLQIAERARKYKDEALNSLYHLIDEELLLECYHTLNKSGSSGVDKTSWYEYGNLIHKRIPELLQEFQSGMYKAPKIRRVYIPKGDGKQRPLGIPTIEDKVLQKGAKTVIEPIYEEIFKDFSYGFRPGKSQHQALEQLYQEVSFGRMHYVIDADLQNYFGSINFVQLREFLDQRVNDGVIRKMINKWLKAGVLEEGKVTYPIEGTPQGGVISPLLSNIYLHYVLDEWFSEQIQPLLKGKSFIIRFADDFVLGFENKEDAMRVMRVLPKRFEKYKLKLHPDKTKIVSLEDESGKGGNFDFLGFTHYMGKSRKGYPILKRKTSKKKFKLAISRMADFIRTHRQMRIKELIEEINLKLTGHYNYYGITFNFRGISKFYNAVCRLLYKWLNRRGGKSIWHWMRFKTLVTEWFTVVKPRIAHSYV